MIGIKRSIAGTMGWLVCALLTSCGSDEQSPSRLWDVGEEVGSTAEMGRPSSSDAGEPAEDQNGPDQLEMTDAGAPLELSGVWQVSNDLPLGSIVQDTYEFKQNGVLIEMAQNPSFSPAGRIAKCEGCANEGPPTENSSCLSPSEERKIGVVCKFAKSWTSQGPSHLSLGLECEDGAPRVANFMVWRDGEKYALWLSDVEGDMEWINFSHGGPGCLLFARPVD